MKVKFLDGHEEEFETLAGADLGGANLSGAELRGAKLRGADLEGAKLSGAVDGEKTPSQRMDEIAAHYEHAKETHPVFADILATSFPLLSRYYKAYIQARHETGECTPVDVLWGECLEVFEAVQARDKSQAVYECYDCIAVLLRLIDMIEETAEKEGWKEERG